MKLSAVILGIITLSMFASVFVNLTGDMASSYDTTYLSEIRTNSNMESTSENIQDLVDTDNLEESDFVSFTFTISKLTYESGKLLLGSINVLFNLIALTFSSSTGITVSSSVIGSIVAMIGFAIAMAFVSIINRGEV